MHLEVLLLIRIIQWDYIILSKNHIIQNVYNINSEICHTSSCDCSSRWGIREVEPAKNRILCTWFIVSIFQKIFSTCFWSRQFVIKWTYDRIFPLVFSKYCRQPGGPVIVNWNLCFKLYRFWCNYYICPHRINRKVKRLTSCFFAAAVLHNLH